MTANFFAACRHNGNLVARRIRLSADIQSSVSGLFLEQEKDFRDGKEELEFNGDWKPEAHEIFTIELPEEGDIFEEAIRANASSVQDIDIKNFSEEEIKAIFMGFTSAGKVKVLVQKFSSAQILNKGKWSFLHDGNVFKRFTQSAFSIGNSLTCIIEDDKIKFKSQYHLRSIIDMKDIYKEATDQEVKNFTSLAILEVADPDAFLNATDQTSRKLISAIMKNDILDKYKAEEIAASASEVGMKIEVQNGKLVVPPHKADFKNLLRFLDDSFYRAALTGQKYITNSKRTAD